MFLLVVIPFLFGTNSFVSRFSFSKMCNPKSNETGMGPGAPHIV